MKDLTGLRSGKLVALELSGRHSNGKLMWLCACDCGNLHRIEARNLSGSNPTKSCGCTRIEKIRLRSTRPSTNLTHGDSKNKLGPRATEHICWSAMIQRCRNPKSIGYKNYGGRGIAVCAAWLESYECFLKDMGRKPFPEASLDRINVNGDYELNNCRWSTWETQNNNRRDNVYVIVGELKMTCAITARQFSIPERTIHNWAKKTRNITSLVHKRLSI